MDEEPQNGPKITVPEIIFVGSFFLLIDLIDLAGLIFALPLSDFTSIVAFPASQVYAFFRGIRQDMLLISNGLELLPYIGSMPLRTIAFGITVYTENNPKLKAALGVAEKLTGKEGAAAGEGAKAGAEAAAQKAATAEESLPPEGAAAPAAAEATPAGKMAAEAEREASEEAFGMPKQWEKQQEGELFEGAPPPPPRPEEEEAGGNVIGGPERFRGQEEEGESTGEGKKPEGEGETPFEIHKEALEEAKENIFEQPIAPNVLGGPQRFNRSGEVEAKDNMVNLKERGEEEEEGLKKAA